MAKTDGPVNRKRPADKTKTTKAKTPKRNSAHARGPKGSATFAEAAQSVLDGKVAVMIEGRRTVVTGRDALAYSFIRRAEAGDLALIQMLLRDRDINKTDRPLVVWFAKGDEKV